MRVKKQLWKPFSDNLHLFFACEAQSSLDWQEPAPQKKLKTNVHPLPAQMMDSLVLAMDKSNIIKENKYLNFV